MVVASKPLESVSTGVGAVGLPTKAGDNRRAKPSVMFRNTSAVMPTTIGASVISCQMVSEFWVPDSTGTIMPAVTSAFSSLSALRAQAPVATT
ncbi:hypothetical protein D3C78_1758600 [compost metagenome]